MRYDKECFDDFQIIHSMRVLNFKVTSMYLLKSSIQYFQQSSKDYKFSFKIRVNVDLIYML